MYDKKATIVIPTKNRPSRLKTSLQYYINKRFLGTILIADSSTGRSIKATASVVEKAKEEGLDIILQRCEKQKHDGDAIKAVNELIETPYAMYCGDDDIAVRQGVIECVDFLEKNHDYMAASGTKGTRIQCGTYVGMHYTGCLELETKYVTERLSAYMRTRICTTYYLHRTEVWKRMFEYADIMPNRWLGGEVLPCCISVMSGKIKNALAETSYHAIHRLNSEDSWIQNLSFIDMLTSEDYVKSAKVMRRVIIRYLVEGGVEQKVAEKIYTKEIWLSTLILLLNKFVERYPHLKYMIDEYSDSLNEYPYEWRRPGLSTTIVADPVLAKLIEEGCNGTSDPFGCE